MIAKEVKGKPIWIGIKKLLMLIEMSLQVRSPPIPVRSLSCKRRKCRAVPAVAGEHLAVTQSFSLWG